ncbi:MAG: type II toxin-antitoxin system RelE/ParE family toxin [Gemmataceae bacterium]|nr:type II toxin-antitoxin system RelE/ParE family toxin [Gemmataceae bacterium]
MTWQILLRCAARKEFDAAGDWYAQQREGLGAVFADAVQRVLDQIAKMPRAHAVAVRDIRRAVVPRFPYCVYYRVRPKTIVVVSVFHTARDPSIWQPRE